MIEQMKKVYLVVLDSAKKEALKTLRKAGLVHIENLEGQSTELSMLKNEYTRLENGAIILSEIKVPKKFIPEEKALEMDSMLELCDKIVELTEKKKVLFSEISSNKNEIERLYRWGGINPEEIQYLTDNGVNLKLYEIPAAKYNLLPESVKTVKVNSDKNNTRFLLLTDDGNRPEELPPEAYEVVLPKKSTDFMAKEIADKSAEITKIDKILEATSVKLPLIKAEMQKLSKSVEFENIFSGMPTDGQETKIAWLTGFLPEKVSPQIRELAQKEKWGLAFADPSEEDNVPTKLKNNKFVSLIYPVTDFLGTVPGYTEYDISGWFLLFFSIFFGIIFGDGGYGILMFLAALFTMFASLAKHKKIGAMSYLLALLGLTTMLWGAATCTWFGLTTPQTMNYVPQFLKDISFKPLSNVTSNLEGIKEVIPMFGFMADKPSVMLSYSDYVSQNLQIFCFILALLQLSVAHLKGIIRYIKSPKFLGEVGSLGMLWGLFFVVLMMVVDSSRFPLPSFVIPLIGGGFALSFIFANYEGKLGASILESCKNIVSVLLGVVNVFSDIVSYIRLWAVGLAGAAIATTVNDMAGPMLGGFIIFAAIMLLVFGHGLNMVLNVLSVIVHGVRLNTLEFSSHLGMSWSGFKYEPFSEEAKKL